jgi:hypothetical protein
VAASGGDPEPLQRLSTRKVYVLVRRLDALLDRMRVAIVVTKVNEIAAERISYCG